MLDQKLKDWMSLLPNGNAIPINGEYKTDSGAQVLSAVDMCVYDYTQSESLAYAAATGIRNKLMSYQNPSEMSKFDLRSPLFCGKSYIEEDPYVRVSGRPYLEPADRVHYVSQLYSIMLRDSNRVTEYPKWVKEDMLEVEKSYLDYMNSPRSRVLPWEKGRDAFFEYYTTAQQTLSPELEAAFIHGIDEVERRIRKMIPAGSLRPYSMEKAADQGPKTTF
nr:ORF1 [Picobirnavirus sp.]